MYKRERHYLDVNDLSRVEIYLHHTIQLLGYQRFLDCLIDIGVGVFIRDEQEEFRHTWTTSVSGVEQLSPDHL